MEGLETFKRFQDIGTFLAVCIPCLASTKKNISVIGLSADVLKDEMLSKLMDRSTLMV